MARSVSPACGAHPTDPMKHRRDPTIATATILVSKVDDVSGQSRFIVAGLGSLALGGSVLSTNAAGSTLRDAELLIHSDHSRCWPVWFHLWHE